MNVLRQWIVDYLKSRDLVKQEIIAIKADFGGFDFVVETKVGTKNIFVVSQMQYVKDFFLKLNENTVILVVFNTRQNLEFLLQHWDKFILNPTLCIFFVAPDSAGDKKWIVYPQTHNSLSDKSSLRSGLESLFSGVDEVFVKDN